MLIARVLSPAHLGVMALALAVGVVVDAAIDLGLSDQVVRHADENDQAFFSTVFWAHMGSSILGVLGMCLAAPWAAAWYKEPALVWVVPGVAAASLMNGMALVPAALLARRLQHKSIALRNTLATLVGGAMGLSLAYAGHGVLALVSMHVANALTGMFMVWWAARWRPLGPGTWAQCAAQLRPVMGMARHTMGTRLLETLVMRMDQLLIGSFFGATVLGLYALAMRLYDVLFLTVCAPIASVMLPYLARAAGDPEAFRTRYKLVLKTTSLVAPPLYVGGALYLPVLLPLLFGPKWIQAGPYIQIMMGVGALQAMGFTHTPAFAALGKPQANWWVTVVSSGLWMCSLTLLPSLGALYAAGLWAGRSTLALGLQVWFLRRLAGLRFVDYWNSIKATTMASLLVLVLAWGSDSGHAFGLSGLWGTGLCMVLSGIIMGAAALAASPEIRHAAGRALRQQGA